MTTDAGPGAQGAQPRGRKTVLSRRKKWLFGLVLAILLVPLIELLSWLGLRSEAVSWDVFKPLYQDQERLAGSGLAPENRAEVLHPYMGFSLNPQTRPEVDVAGRRIAVNRLGFADDGPSLFTRSPERFIVGIAGGSVAQQMGVLAADTLRSRLSQSAALHGRKIQLVRTAFQGFKEPQQLMAINYLLSLGGQLDALINLDGFNEVALAPCENRAAGVFAAYPRLWFALTVDALDPRGYAEAYRMLALRASRQESARAILSSPFRFSPTRNLVWKIHDLYLQNEIAVLGEKMLLARESTGRGFATTGPEPDYHNGRELYEELSEIWMNSSLQLDRLCRGNDIIYVHALQPNQYAPGLNSTAEPNLSETLDRDRCFSVAVKAAYPLLILKGKKLRAAGVDFHDLTHIFDKVEGLIYADNCCHYTKKGYDLVATALADQILKRLDQPRKQ